MQMIITLEKLLEEIPNLREGKRTDPKFKNWEAKTTRTIKNLFGDESNEYGDFSRINFWYHWAGLLFEMVSEDEYNRRNFQNGLDEAELLLTDLIEEAKFNIKNPDENLSTRMVKNIFLSHSSKDDQLAKEITNLLEAIGVPSSQIFNSSMPGYGVKPGEDWVQTLKSTISSEGVVVSLISTNYYKSTVSLCEMGATWVLSKSHFPIVLPPLTFEEIKGIIPTKHGIMINDSERWSELKEVLEKIFDLTPIPVAKWEGKKKDILERIEQLLPAK